MHGEDQRIPAWIVVEHSFRRRVRQDAPIPIELAVDPHGGKGRRQRARRHHMLHRQFAVAAVEIAHFAGADMSRADRETRRAAIGQIEIDELVQRLLERNGRIIAGVIGTQRIGIAGMRQRIGPEETWNAMGHGRPIGQLLVEAGKRGAPVPYRLLLHPLPELLQARQAVLGRVAGNEARIDRTDRGADDPVRLDAGFVQGLVDPGLVRAERAAALKHEHDLTRQVERPVLRIVLRAHVSLLVSLHRSNIRLAAPAHVNARSNRRRPAAQRR